MNATSEQNENVFLTAHVLNVLKHINNKTWHSGKKYTSSACLQFKTVWVYTFSLWTATYSLSTSWSFSKLPQPKVWIDCWYEHPLHPSSFFSFLCSCIYWPRNRSKWFSEVIWMNVTELLINSDRLANPFGQLEATQKNDYFTNDSLALLVQPTEIRETL